MELLYRLEGFEKKAVMLIFDIIGNSDNSRVFANIIFPIFEIKHFSETNFNRPCFDREIIYMLMLISRNLQGVLILSFSHLLITKDFNGRNR